MKQFHDLNSQGKPSKGELTRLRIIESALHLFHRHGFSEVTLQDIAKRSKTSHPLIIKHFGSKSDLLKAVRKYVSFSNHSWVDAKISPSMTGYEALYCHLYENLNWAFHNPAEAKIILLSYYFNSVDSTATPSGTAAQRLGFERIHRYALQAEREGILSLDYPTTLVAEMCHEYTVGLFTKLLTQEGNEEKAKLPILYKKKLTFFLSLFFPEAP